MVGQRTIRRIQLIAGILAVCFLTSGCTSKYGELMQEGGMLDHLLLTEYINPAYFTRLSPEHVYLWEVSADAVGKWDNLFLNGVEPQTYQGVTFTIEADGSIVISGANEGENLYWRCAAPGMKMKDGNYILSDGGVSSKESGVYLYLEGWKWTEGSPEPEKTLLATLPEQGTFTIDSSLYNEYWCGIRIPTGAPGRELRFLPMIREAKNEDSRVEAPYMDCPMLYYEGEDKLKRIASFFMKKEEFLALPETDYQIFLNNIRYIYGMRYHCLWCSIVFQDGTGIMWENCDPDHGIYGEVDNLGRILKAYGEVEIKDGRLKLDQGSE